MREKVYFKRYLENDNRKKIRFIQQNIKWKIEINILSHIKLKINNFQ